MIVHLVWGIHAERCQLFVVVEESELELFESSFFASHSYPALVPFQLLQRRIGEVCPRKSIPVVMDSHLPWQRYPGVNLAFRNTYSSSMCIPRSRKRYYCITLFLKADIPPFVGSSILLGSKFKELCRQFVLFFLTAPRSRVQEAPTCEWEVVWAQSNNPTAKHDSTAF
jgi:hypothetical protein